MENVNCVPRTPQQLMDENREFLENLRPEDIEYSDSAMIAIMNSSNGTAEDVLEELRATDPSDFFYDRFPRDRSSVFIDKDYYPWQIHYYDEHGKEYQYVEDLLEGKICDRVVKIISPPHQS